MFNTLHDSGRLLMRTAPIALLLLASANLYAQHSMSISLRASEAVPPATTAAMGTGQITMQPDATVSDRMQPSGLAPTAAQMDEDSTGKNGPPIVTLADNADRRFTTAPQTELTDVPHSSYMACMLYMNVPSAQHADDEIRAHLQSTGAPTKSTDKPIR